jgi:hypothetical protein
MRRHELEWLARCVAQDDRRAAAARSARAGSLCRIQRAKRIARVNDRFRNFLPVSSARQSGQGRYGPSLRGDERLLRRDTGHSARAHQLALATTRRSASSSNAAGRARGSPTLGANNCPWWAQPMHLSVRPVESRRRCWPAHHGVEFAVLFLRKQEETITIALLLRG